MSVGQRIAEARERAGLNQSEFARRLRVRPQSVQQWELDVTAPRSRRMDEIASVLGVSPAWVMFGGAGAPEDFGGDRDGSVNIGARIKEARQELGWTQEELGLACGWTEGNPQGRIGNYERNVREPSAAGLMKLARVLRKPIEYFYQSVSDDEPAGSVPDSGFYNVVAAGMDDIELLKEIITEVERVAEDELLPLTPEQRAKAICAVLRAVVTHGIPVASGVVLAAVQAAGL